eukprot:1161802-Pelagomonas_calceolata.AAC.10
MTSCPQGKKGAKGGKGSKDKEAPQTPEPPAREFPEQCGHVIAGEFPGQVGGCRVYAMRRKTSCSKWKICKLRKLPGQVGGCRVCSMRRKRVCIGRQYAGDAGKGEHGSFLGRQGRNCIKHTAGAREFMFTVRQCFDQAPPRRLSTGMIMRPDICMCLFDHVQWSSGLADLYGVLEELEGMHQSTKAQLAEAHESSAGGSSKAAAAAAAEASAAAVQAADNGIARTTELRGLAQRLQLSTQIHKVASISVAWACAGAVVQCGCLRKRKREKLHEGAREESAGRRSNTKGESADATCAPARICSVDDARDA